MKIQQLLYNLVAKLLEYCDMYIYNLRYSEEESKNEYLKI